MTDRPLMRDVIVATVQAFIEATPDDEKFADDTYDRAIAVSVALVAMVAKAGDVAFATVLAGFVDGMKKAAVPLHHDNPESLEAAADEIANYFPKMTSLQ
jgi:hypothetical protein